MIRVCNVRYAPMAALNGFAVFGPFRVGEIINHVLIDSGGFVITTGSFGFQVAFSRSGLEVNQTDFGLLERLIMPGGAIPGSTVLGAAVQNFVNLKLPVHRKAVDTRYLIVHMSGTAMAAPAAAIDFIVSVVTDSADE